MSYVYKNGNKYIYKRRIPYSHFFHSFTLSTNKKISEKIARYFTKISKDFFIAIKVNKMAVWDFDRISYVLDEYTQKALEEFSDYETKRHLALAKLFPTTKKILGKMEYLSGGHKKVIKKALAFYEWLANSYAIERRADIDKHGKELVDRSTTGVQELYKEYKDDKDNEQNLYNFLSMLFKAEGTILKEDKKRSSRFSSKNKSFDVPVHPLSESASYTKSLVQKTVTVSDVIENFLWDKSNYKIEDLENSKSMATKAKKITQLILDVSNELTEGKITQFDEKIVKRVCEILLFVKIDRTGQGLLDVYKKQKTQRLSELENRSVTTVKSNLDIVNRFLDFLIEKHYIDEEQKQDYTQIVVNSIKDISRKQKKGELKRIQDEEAFTIPMLRSIFNRNSKYYFTIFDCIESGKRYTKPNGEALTILSYWTKFYVPILLLFTGARVNEIISLKIEDFEIDQNGIAKFFIESGKTDNARRVNVVNDFIMTDLRFSIFYAIAKKQKRKYLFEQEPSDLVSKSFNRVKDSCIKEHYTKEDKFNNNRYSLHSLRHNFSSHLSLKGVDSDLRKKIQGHSTKNVSQNYISISVENQVKLHKEKFTLHKQIDFSEFIKLANRLEGSFKEG